MEDTESPMFEEQAEAVRLYCTKKIESHSSTVVGLCGMADRNIYYMIFPPRKLEDIIGAIYCVRIGGYLRLFEAASYAYSFWFGNKDTDMQKRIVFFAGGPLYCPLDEGEDLARALMNRNVACDAISFGDPNMKKRELFDTLIKITDNSHGNCNVCHVPPESSIPEALSRSEIIIPRAGGGSSSPPTSPDKEEMAIQPIQICVKAPPTADANTDCPFCQWVLLTLEEKNVLYDREFIDLGNKPDWFVDANPDGLLPLISFGDGKWVSNSDVIVKMI
ncbi:dehydroascorbate reductase 2 [Tanacetum coccineum]|uniref:glutathione transferase n=1 Tax=Tanacetum coccineum TaxID=301880 RepID=A0ABQ5I7Z1_9ASTR